MKSLEHLLKSEGALRCYRLAGGCSELGSIWALCVRPDIKARSISQLGATEGSIGNMTGAQRLYFICMCICIIANA